MCVCVCSSDGVWVLFFGRGVVDNREILDGVIKKSRGGGNRRKVGNRKRR